MIACIVFETLIDGTAEISNWCFANIVFMVGLLSVKSSCFKVSGGAWRNSSNHVIWAFLMRIIDWLSNQLGSSGLLLPAKLMPAK